MKPTVLQPDQRQSFDENGYLVCPEHSRGQRWRR